MSDKRIGGVVARFDNAKGFGHINGGDGQSYFVHYSAIRGAGYRNLDMGERVDFIPTKSDRGPKAIDVVRRRFLEAATATSQQ